MQSDSLGPRTGVDVQQFAVSASKLADIITADSYFKTQT